MRLNFKLHKSTHYCKYLIVTAYETIKANEYAKYNTKQDSA